MEKRRNAGMHLWTNQVDSQQFLYLSQGTDGGGRTLAAKPHDLS